MVTPSARKLVVIIDDDPLGLEAAESLLRSWGCQVVAAESYREVMPMLVEIGRRPDLIICDYHLPHGETGVAAIERLRSAFEIPALLISADTTSLPCSDSADGYRFLCKPVNAHTFRAMLVDAAVLRR